MIIHGMTNRVAYLLGVRVAIVIAAIIQCIMAIFIFILFVESFMVVFIGNGVYLFGLIIHYFYIKLQH